MTRAFYEALTKWVMEYIRDHPGCTTNDILEFVPNRYPREAVWLRVVYLASIYEIENRGGAGRDEDVRWYILEWQPMPFYLEMAKDVITAIDGLPPRKRAPYLARRMQQYSEDRGIPS